MLEEERTPQDEPYPKQAPPQRRWTVVATVLALFLAAGAFGYGLKQSYYANQVNQQNVQLATAMKEMQLQMTALTAKMMELSAPPAPQPAAAPASSRVAAPKRTVAKRPVEDKRWKEVRAKLAEHDKVLATTKEEMERTRTDLDGRLSSTREELNGSIARTDNEVALLKRRGERDITEFDLFKSKELQRTGPIALALRKADTKRKRYNVDLLVEDSRMEKKNVNLYEPIWIHRADDPQPVQVVVYSITKDRVRGYVNAPKYRQSQLAPAPAPGGQGAGETKPQP